MKRTTQCLLLFLAMSCACAINLSQIADSFNEESDTYKVGKVDTITFFRDFFPNLSKIIRNLVNEAALELFRQLRLQSHILANSINSVNDELQYAVDNTDGNHSGLYMEKLMTKLNLRLGKFLDLGPGTTNDTIIELPPIKENQVVKGFSTYHPLKELFSNIGPIIDANLAHVSAHIDNFYKDGWRASRRTYGNIQKDFKADYLNGYLLDAYGKVVINIFKNAEIIQKHVRAETWHQFVQDGSQIRRIYEEIKPVVTDDM